MLFRSTFGTLSLSGSSTNTEVYVARIDSKGAFTWVNRGYCVKNYCEGLAVAQGSGGAAVVAGTFSGGFSFGGKAATANGSNDMFVARLDAAGKVQWLTTAGGVQADQARGVAMDGAGAVYVTGLFNSQQMAIGSIKLNATPKTSNQAHAWVAGLTAGGAVSWASTTGRGQGMAVSVAAGQPHVAGTFLQSATFGGKTVTAKGGVDAFVWRPGTAGP